MNESELRDLCYLGQTYRLGGKMKDARLPTWDEMYAEIERLRSRIDELKVALLLAGKRVREANDETSRACIADAVDRIARAALAKEGK